MKFLFNILIICLVISCKLFSQDYSFRVYDSRDGYHSQETESIYYQSLGYLWIGGVDGLTRYDGSKYIHYTKYDGLIDNEIQSISEDKKCNLWISTTKGISYFDGKSFTNYTYILTDTINDLPYFIKVFEASNGNIYACSATGLYVLNKSKKCFIQYSSIQSYVSDIVEDKEGTIWISGSLALYKIKNNIIKKIDLTPIIDYNTATCLAFDKKQQLWIGTTKGILKYNGVRFDYYFSGLDSKNNILDVIVLSDSSIVFTSSNFELKIFKKNHFQIVNLSKEISNVSIHGCAEDNSGNLWLAADKLVKLYKKPLSVHQISKEVNSTINDIKINKETMYVASDNGLKVINNDGIKTFYPTKKQDSKIITTLFKNKSFLLVGTNGGSIYKFQNNKFTPFDTTFDANNPVYSILEVNPKEYWFNSLNYATHFKNGISTYYTLSDPVSAITQNAIMDYQKNIWFANLEHLVLFKHGTNQLLDIDTGFNYKAPVTLIEDKNHILWIGTYGDGLVRYNRRSSQNYSTKNGLASDYITSSYYDEQNNMVWIGTGNGISKVSLDDKSNISSIKSYVSEEVNLDLSCNINSICRASNGNMLFGCGSSIIEYNKLLDENKKTELILHFEGLRLNYEKSDWKDYSKGMEAWTNMPISLELPFDKNHLTFDFIAINFNSTRAIKYQWKLMNVESNWSPSSKSNFATYTNLSPGTYTFCIRASNALNQWSDPLLYSFTILPPFYQTWWFLPLLLVILFTIAYLNSEYQIKKVKAEEKTKTENFKRLAELELKAMRAQMNPHFMFNTLNSIQDIVLNKDDEKARIYLADFALMMRMILENSTQKEISFEKEIEFIQLYLKMEVLRFETKFKIIFNISEELELSHLKIPPMLIQPYIENAINHGLMHKTENGLLTISFEIETRNEIECLKCTVLDNGIGRKKAKEYAAWKTKKHQSMATEITNERLQLLNGIHTTKGFEVNIHDLENETHEALGTKVELYIPIN
jgi:ligand-binding sensor domain-containing protein